MILTDRDTFYIIGSCQAGGFGRGAGRGGLLAGNPCLKPPKRRHKPLVWREPVRGLSFAPGNTQPDPSGPSINSTLDLQRDCQTDQVSALLWGSSLWFNKVGGHAVSYFFLLIFWSSSSIFLQPYKQHHQFQINPTLNFFSILKSSPTWSFEVLFLSCEVRQKEVSCTGWLNQLPMLRLCHSSTISLLLFWAAWNHHQEIPAIQIKVANFGRLRYAAAWQGYRGKKA